MSMKRVLPLETLDKDETELTIRLLLNPTGHFLFLLAQSLIIFRRRLAMITCCPLP